MFGTIFRSSSSTYSVALETQMTFCLSGPCCGGLGGDQRILMLLPLISCEILPLIVILRVSACVYMCISSPSLGNKHSGVGDEEFFRCHFYIFGSSPSYVTTFLLSLSNLYMSCCCLSFSPTTPAPSSCSVSLSSPLPVRHDGVTPGCGRA